MDNLPAYKVKGVTQIIEKTGARIIYLSPYYPEFNQARASVVTVQEFLT